nr:PREDICTED: uncharacterized protein LOC109039370 [Bemisia tabaci]
MTVENLRMTHRSQSLQCWYHSSSLTISLPIAILQLLMVTAVSGLWGGDPGHTQSLGSAAFSRGDVLITKDKQNQLLAAISTKDFVMAKKSGNEVEIFTTQPQNSRTPVQNSPVKVQPGWNADKRVALAMKLSGKMYPYNSVSCHEKDYMKYIVYGKTNQPLTGNSACPLRRDLSAVSIAEIKSPGFYLESKNKRVIVDQLPKASAG